MLLAAGTHIGLVRQTNQDVFEISEHEGNHPFLIVADGMGGASAGEVASRIAVDAVREHLAVGDREETAQTDWIERLREAVMAANRAVWDAAEANEEYRGMGTTLVAAVCENHQVVFAHVGDSRGYLMHVNYLKQVTKDHSLVAELVRRGQLTPDEAIHHPQRNIVTRSLGAAREMLVDMDVESWDEGDVILLCSDGLSNLVSERELLNYMVEVQSAQSTEDVQNTVQQLIDLGLERGASDNITVAIAVHNEGNDNV